ncbi:MAG TPA: putative transporter [Methylococcaceae bacterium]|nr:putative transporter [Methylococcaceae bacterium]
MNWFFELISEESVPHSLIVISLVSASGLALGRLKLFNFNLGIAGVLFTGLAFGHFEVTISSEILHFLREFGLILFVYAIGLQVGPGFIHAFYHHGILLNILAAAIVLLGALTAVSIGLIENIPIAAIVGLFSGATTNTPSLAAAQEVLGGLPTINAETLKLPGMGYAVAYPFGIIGIILSMLLIKRVFNVMIQHEADVFSRIQRANAQAPVWKDLTVENPNLNDITIGEISFFEAMSVVVTRILHDGQVSVASIDSRLHTGDSIRLVGSPKQLAKLKMLIGPEANVNIQDISSNLHTGRFVVTNKKAVGQSIAHLRALFGVTISRIHRPDVEFTPTGAMHVHFGDELLAVGSKEGLAGLEELLGNSLETLNHPQIVPIFIGIGLGILLGSWPIWLPGMPSAVKLGLAGGPLIVAIVLSRIGNWGTMTWHLPKSSNIILKDMGIVLFLAAVGLHSGDRFIDTLIQGDGFFWMACAALITLLPLLLVGFIARLFFKLNYLSLCGLLAGSMTDPPALAFANGLSPSPAVSIAYATVYPLVMILRIMAAQLMIILLI